MCSKRISGVFDQYFGPVIAFHAPPVSNSPAESIGFAMTSDLLDIFVLVPLVLENS